MQAAWLRQGAAGIIVGLSAVIYALSYGALLFSGSLAVFVGYGISIALLTAVFGALLGLLAEEKTFVGGPDSNTISVLASMLAPLGVLGMGPDVALTQALITILATSVVLAAVFYGVARADLAGLVRYIPFPVMAGFLASTGWLMASGALNIIAGLPLSRAGWTRFAANPLQPELYAGLGVAGVLFFLASRVSKAVLIPAVTLSVALGINALLASGLCTACRAENWLFPALDAAQWLPPWRLQWHYLDVDLLLQSLPGMLVVSFVGLLTVLISVASLELEYQEEFHLAGLLKVHAGAAAVSALLGGFAGIVSIGRTSLNRQAGGGAISNVITAAVCMAALLGGGILIVYIPKAALGGLVLYLGLGLMKQWLWDQRLTVSKFEFGQICLILVLVANYGFMLGFATGIVISCLVFIVSLSRIPLAELATDLSLYTSSIVRPERAAQTLRSHGAKTRLYRLGGYLFFGSASRIDAVFAGVQQTGADEIEGVVMDFTNVSGIDSSAIGVFQRMLRRYRDRQTRFYFIPAAVSEQSLRKIAEAAPEHVRFFASVDHALEAAESDILARWGTGVEQERTFAFYSEAERVIFLDYCEPMDVPAGGCFCRQGEQSDALFFVTRGACEVIRHGVDGKVLRLAKLLPGAMAGELAFYSGEERAASIVATLDSSAYVMRRDSLERLRITHPDIAAALDSMVIRKIAQDLKRMNQLVTLLR